LASKSELLLMAVAVKRGLLTQETASAAIDEQKARAAAGSEIDLIDLLIAKGLLQPKDVAELAAIVGALENRPRGIPIEEARRIPIYDIREKIGEGGMATVFRAVHRETGQWRAVKVLFKEHLSNKQFVERFIREGKLLKQFDCPNIARGYEYGRAGKELYFMGMELVEGSSLQDILDKEGPFTEQKAIHCITEAARALAYMQSQGIVHRDIKPDNIMWNADGRVMLIDLGFAKPIAGDGATDDYEAETCGTVQYISPEQAKGKADVDIRADIYSLGATLYHLVIGQTPFTGKDSTEVMAKQVMENLDAHKLKGGRISMHMHYFIEKMMAKDRDIRYQSAADVVGDIEAVLAGAADLQYNPDDDETVEDPFANMSRRMGAISARALPARSVRMPMPGSSARLAPAPGAASGRLAPSQNGPGHGSQHGGPGYSTQHGAGHSTQHGNGTNTAKIVRMPEPRQSSRLKPTETAQIIPRLPPKPAGQ
jgi:serine/threonine protein kinase